MNRITRTLARAAAAGTLVAAVGGAALATTAAPASAASGLSCHTGTAGSFPSYYGWASCTGAGLWSLKVQCLWGAEYTAGPQLNIGDTQLLSAGSCNWGVSSVTVIQHA